MKPILTLFRKNGQIPSNQVWCQYCEMYHAHGLLEGHRVVHCINFDSTYLETGYYIKLQKDET